MRDASKYIVSVVGAGALVASVLTDALASHPNASGPRPSRAAINSNLNVNGILHVSKNETVYGNFYTKGKAEVYQGLTIRDKGLNVRAGGIKGDTLDVSGALHAQSGVIDQNLNVTANLQAANISGTSLTLAGAATVGGTLAASGRITGNGVDAGSGGLTTSGNVTASGLAATNLRVTGAVDFSGATVSGINLSGVLGGPNGVTISQLTVGNATGTTPSLFLAGNGRTVPIGVESSGAVTVPALRTTGDVTVGGNLSVTGTSSLAVSSLVAPNGTNNQPGPLSLTGNGITLTGNTTVTGNEGVTGNLTVTGNQTVNGTSTHNGTTTITGNNDLVLAAAAANPTATPAAGATTSHLVANRDVAGTTTLSVAAANISATNPAVLTSPTIAFNRSYNTPPIIVVTPAGDPSPGNANAPKVWVSVVNTSGGAPYTGFVINYQNAPSSTQPSTPYNVVFNYHVIG